MSTEEEENVYDDDDDDMIELLNNYVSDLAIDNPTMQFQCPGCGDFFNIKRDEKNSAVRLFTGFKETTYPKKLYFSFSKVTLRPGSKISALITVHAGSYTASGQQNLEGWCNCFEKILKILEISQTTYRLDYYKKTNNEGINYHFGSIENEIVTYEFHNDYPSSYLDQFRDFVNCKKCFTFGVFWILKNEKFGICLCD